MFTTLCATEASIETAAGLVAVLSYIQETASADDRARLRPAEGFLLYAVENELTNARRGVTALFEASPANDDRRQA